MSALGRMHFVPAEIGGKKVRQLVQMPFLFKLSR
jgi:outer membrane biosynthesis protein TonB